MTTTITSDRAAPGPGGGIAGMAARALGFATIVVAIGWILSLPQHLGFLVYTEQAIAVILGLSLTIVFLTRDRRGERQDRPAIYDWLLALASIWLGAHLAVRFPILSEGSFFHPTESFVIGLLAVVLIVEGMRRVVGWSLIIVFLVLFAYALFGDLVPGRLEGRSMALADVFAFLGTDSTALLGPALIIASFVVLMFVLFGRLLVGAGGGDVFTALASALAGNGKGGAAKVAVIASGLFGTISGSAVSNVMSTGVVTIPLMKRSGFPRHSAGAVEAVASTGGQLMPPVMGAAAFLMAEYLRVPYSDIVVAALLPALLYYGAVYLQIDLMARKLDLPLLTEVQRYSLAQVMRTGWLVAVSFAVLLVAIFAFGRSVEFAAVWAAGTLAALSFLFGRGEARLTPRRLLAIATVTGQSIADIVLICALAGMIIGLLTTTGLGFALSFVLLELGQNMLLVLLLVTAAVSLVLGMGMPTTGVYLLLATLAAPPLVQLGVQPIAAHMFVLYFGMLSMITPPVALAAFAAANIAQADPIRTALEAVRFGWVAFLVPFLFIFQPAVLMHGSPTAIVAVIAALVVAIALVTAGLVGFGRRPLSPAERAAALVLGGLVLAPATHLPGGTWTEIGAFVIGLMAIALHVYGTRQAGAGVRA